MNKDRKLQTESRSRYFIRKVDHSISTEEEQKMSAKFVASNGSRRGNQDYLSSDELDGPATIGQHADVVPLSPDSRRQSVSPMKTVSRPKSREASSEEQPVEPSNIKRTFFTSPQPRYRGTARHQDDFEQSFLDVPSSFWSVPLAAVNLPGQDLHVNSDMKLVFDKVKNLYSVFESGDPLKVSNARLEVDPSILQKVCWGRPGGKIRFESSKRGTADNILDLELKSEKDLADLLKKLQGGSYQVKLASEDKCVNTSILPQCSDTDQS